MKVLFNWDVVEMFFVWTNFSHALNLLTIFSAVASLDIVSSDI